MTWMPINMVPKHGEGAAYGQVRDVARESRPTIDGALGNGVQLILASNSGARSRADDGGGT